MDGVGAAARRPSRLGAESRSAGAERTAPLLGAQEYEWLKTLITGNDPGSDAMTVAFQVPIPEGCAIEVVVDSLAEVVERHESLRTVVRDEGAGPLQVVYPPRRPEIDVCPTASGERSEAFRTSVRRAAGRFADGTPLHAGVLHDGGRPVELFVAVSHMCCDGFSRQIIEAELGGLLAGRPGPGGQGLRPPATQACDAALAERSDEGSRGRAAARAHWEAMARQLPNRLVPPREQGVCTRFGFEYTSALTPPLLHLASRTYRASPAIIFEATLHAGLTILSGQDRSVLRGHFAGRGAADRGTVGCFHQVLSAIVDTGDRPGFAELVRRTARARLEAQRRHRISHLSLRRILLREERRRGVSFAEGSTLNFVNEAGFERLAELSAERLRDLRDRAAEHRLLLLRRETTADPIGEEAYVLAINSAANTLVVGSFNGAVFTPAQMRFLIGLPDALLARAACADVSWQEIEELSAPADRGAPPRHRRGADDFDPAEVLRAVQTCPGVLSARLDHVPGSLSVTVVADDPALDEPAVRAHVMAQLAPARRLVCPDTITVEAAHPTRPRAAEGVPPAESRLLDLLRDEGFVEAPRADLSYVECGGRLDVVPALLARLREAGLGGLTMNDFLRPADLRHLAARVATADEDVVEPATSVTA
ncbi:condensation domain-containing protein [Streptomyces sp. B6B3]|uniref:condensation domain-containing protein n=1 Tax=Streptomyces sp. B6B3 TaxID=3153570 RepID=UPI00325F1CDB